jgi:hypothetical protein
VNKNETKNNLLLQRVYGQIYLQYKNIAINRFKWTGLPPNMKEKYIEEVLFNEGRVAFYDSSKYGLIALPCNPDGEVNVYGEHLKYKVNGYNHIEDVEEFQNSVIIRNNELETPTSFYIRTYAERLAKIERLLDVNIDQQKTPYIIKGTDKNILTLKNIIKQVQDGEIAIYLDKNMDMNIEVLKTTAPFIAIETMDYKNQVRNELHTFLGINNANTDKKERLLSNEVDSNNEVIISHFEMQLSAREKARDQINEMFGCNVNVEPRVIGGVENGESDPDDTGDS